MSSVEGDGGERAEVLIELAHAEYLAGRYDRCLESGTTGAWNAVLTPRTRPPVLTAATSWRAARWCCRT